MGPTDSAAMVSNVRLGFLVAAGREVDGCAAADDDDAFPTLPLGCSETSAVVAGGTESAVVVTASVGSKRQTDSDGDVDLVLVAVGVTDGVAVPPAATHPTAPPQSQAPDIKSEANADATCR